jgi:hypothetical protein
MLFARQRDLSRYAGWGNQGIVFSRPGFERLLAFTPGGANTTPDITPDITPDVTLNRGATVGVHELAHDLSRWFLPVQPLWLSEGLAMYLESIELDLARGQAVTGAVSGDAIASLRSATHLPSTARLFATRDASATDPRDATSFYLGSWALVHYLRSEQPEAFERFQRALMDLTPWRTAWAQSFPGLSHAALDRKLRAYLSSGRFPTARARFSPAAFTPELRVLSAAEVHGVHALLANTSGQAIADAEAAAALALDPGELNALTVRFHSLPQGADTQRAAIAARAVAAHADQAGAWLLSALAGNTSERRLALARAERLDPNHPGVVGLLAEDALARNDPHTALLHV